MTDPIPYKDFVSGLFNRSGSPAQDFAHAVLGLTTEVHEIDYATDGTNAIEEIGDLAFYGQALELVVSEAFGIDLDDVAIQNLGDLLAANPNWEQVRSQLVGEEVDDGLVSSIRAFLLCELQDTAKRWIGYGKGPSRDRALEAVAMAAAVCDISVVMVSGDVPGSANHTRVANLAVAANRDKLIARYGGLKFSQDAALNRDLTNEAKVLHAVVASTS